MSQDDVVAVVTGAASGVGRGVAAACLRHGTHVAAIDRRWPEGQHIMEEPDGGAGPRLVRIDCDVSDWQDVASAGRRIATELETVGMLFNCAGIGLFGRRIEDTSLEDWDSVIDINLRGAFLMTKALLPMLLASRGAIVNIGSVHSLATTPGNAAYSASKAGLSGLTKGIAADYGAVGLRATCVLLGSVDTPMGAQHGREAAERGIALPDIPPWQQSDPGGVAEAIYFLATETARFMNGANIPIDGGLLGTL
jgi:meso-butanediol dehydrogenase / (S,S)-butanediol dehydrogenase / diacetyl reductase